MKVYFLPCLVLSFILSACVSDPSTTSDRVLVRNTAGPSTIAALAKICGAQKIDVYEQSYIDYLATQHPLTGENKAEIHRLFMRADRLAEAQFPNPGDLEKFCAEHPDQQSLIDKGIAGDFSGLGVDGAD